MNIPLSIIIVNWNSCDYLIPCIRSIYNQTKTTCFEVIVVDNASYDRCDKKLTQEFPEVIFIQSNENLGFAKANNLGATRARGEVLLFLNPDTEIVNNAIDHFYSTFLTLPDAGIAGCRLLNRDGSVQKSSIQSFPTILNQMLDADFLRRFFPNSKLWGTAPLFKGDTSQTAVDVVSGACLMIKRSAFELVGMFSPEYFMYSEDVDLCYKVHQAGWKTYHLPTVASARPGMVID